MSEIQDEIIASLKQIIVTKDKLIENGDKIIARKDEIILSLSAQISTCEAIIGKYDELAKLNTKPVSNFWGKLFRSKK